LRDLPFILIVPAALVPVGLLLNRFGVELGTAGWNAFSFLFLILPVTLWLAWREAAPRSATPGKRWQRLTVVDAASGEPTGYRQALLRNLFKVALPWELGHTVAFGFSAAFQPGGSGTVGAGLIAVSVACYALVILYVAALFLGNGRTPYDRLSGTSVVEAGNASDG
jgi:uncharacterized RDD family membrane protein YckC